MARNEHSFIETSALKLNDLRSAKTELAGRYIHGKKVEMARRAGTQISAMPRAMAAISPNPLHNVVGVGIGERISEGKPTGTLAVKLFVRMKYPLSEISSNFALPKEINGVPTDIEEAGIFRRFQTAAARKLAGMPNPRTKMRPAHPGSSIGFQDPANQFVMAGTFGAVVKDAGGTYILSNNHVLADENRLPTGAPIFQPGLLDGGNVATDQVAALTRFVMLDPSKANSVDCAIAKVTQNSIVSTAILHIGAPKGSADAALDMNVHKFGRTTGYTVGQVSSIDTDVTVNYETGDYTFSGQVIVVGSQGQSFSDAGDSGSLILQRGTNKAVALLFAGSKTHTIANHIGHVLAALKVKLA
jgi:Peptidase family S64